MKEIKDLLPSDIDVSNHFWDSAFRNHETETVARNFVIVSQRLNPETWVPFSFEDYRRICEHPVSAVEHGVLDALVTGGRPVFGTETRLEPGYLLKEGGRYFVTEKFLAVLAKFAK